MADNLAYSPGSGANVAADDIGGIHYQRAKLVWGVDGTATDASRSDPLPIVQIGATPAGTNAIGKLAANSGVDIGDVDVTSVTPGTAASSLGKAEDGAHTSGDVGVMALAVRKDTPANLSGTDADYEPLQMAGGRLWTSTTVDAALPAGTNNIGDVDVASSALPTGASTSAKQDTMIGHLDGVEGILTTIDGDTGNISTKIDTLAGAVSGSEVQVDVLTLPDATVVGKAAHDAAVSGNPILNGLEGRRARATAVSADGDATRIVGDRYGRVSICGIDLSLTAVDATSSGDTALIAAPGASTRIKLIRVEASNTHATTALTASLKTAAHNSGAVFGKKYLPAAGGQAVWNFPGGHLICGSNEALNLNLSSAGTVSFTSYYETIAD